ncbi:MAG: type II secretion system protein [Armatimonadota bacterium]
MSRTHSNERGFTFVEVLAVVMLLGILIAVAMPQYFGAQGDALRNADIATFRGINSAIALYQFRNNGACPGQAGQATFASFANDVLYFPDGPPNDPRTNPGSITPYSTTYVPADCRVKESVGGTNHRTGTGH